MRALLRRLAVAAALVAALALPVYAASLIYVANAQAVTASNAAITFTDNGSGGSSSAFNARYVTVINSGSNEIFVDWRDTTATTSDWRIDPAESFTFGPFDLTTTGGGVPGIGVICSAAETSTARILATR